MRKCTCTFAQQIGDGCEVCNPALALEVAVERIEDLEAENAALRASLSRAVSRIGCGCGGDYGLCKYCEDALDTAPQEQKDE